MSAPVRSPPSPRDEAVDLLGDEALVPREPRLLDLVLARAAATLLDDAAVRRREHRVAEERARLGRRAGRGRVNRASSRPAPRSARSWRGCARGAGSRAPRSRSRTRARPRDATCRSRAAGAANLRTRRARRRRGHPYPGSARGRARGSARSSRRRERHPARTARAARRGRRTRTPQGPRRPGRSGAARRPGARSPVATAASNALPPRSSTAIPVCDASQCVDATIPKVPRSSGRVVKLRGRTTKYALNGSCSSRCTSIDEKPASARSSRAFCSPHIAPRPSPPCASETVMQCMHEIM